MVQCIERVMYDVHMLRHKES